MATPSASAPAEEEHIFYNVLPQEKSSGPLANTAPGAMATTAAPIATSQIATGSSKISLPKLNPRLLLMIGGAVVVLGVAGFFGYRLLFSNSEAPIEAPQNIPPVEEPAEPTQPEGVTTSPEWQKQYFGDEVCQTVNVCGDESDPDRDGLTNIEENSAATDPNNSDSDGDGLSDGDEVHVFATDPLKNKTKDGQYTDKDYAQYGYDINTDQQFSADPLAALIAKIKEYGLHQPSITSLGEEALKYYDFTNITTPGADPLQGVDTSAEAQLERDVQRQDTIKKIGAALLKFQADNKTFPVTTEFDEMVTAIKSYVVVATNYIDPINKDKYIYNYVPGSNGADFTLTYFSETQNLLIKYTSTQAQADVSKISAAELDDSRTRDLETLQTALLLYSSHNIDSHSTQQYVFPTTDQYKAALLSGNYISQIPADPKTGLDYPYTVGEKFDTFTLKAILDNPPSGFTGYMCDQTQCKPF
jgi:hypothetical protein